MDYVPPYYSRTCLQECDDGNVVDGDGCTRQSSCVCRVSVSSFGLRLSFPA